MLPPATLISPGADLGHSRQPGCNFKSLKRDVRTLWCSFFAVPYPLLTVYAAHDARTYQERRRSLKLGQEMASERCHGSLFFLAPVACCWRLKMDPGPLKHMAVDLNYRSKNGGNICRDPY